ncbi:MAG: nitrate reductase [Rhodospirillaceae bacterium]|nr:MAG: nitrate reductase [Rhodospirillaceae bacterium]
MAKSVHTTCPYCGVGCGIIATPDDDGTYTIKGDPNHPANFGRLCSKGSALGQTLSDDGRLMHPVIDGEVAEWDTALNLVADTFKSTIEKHGPDAVAFYVSGQLMTEAYYVANKLMKGFMGSSNIDTNSRLCMASTVAGHKRAFGSDTVPGNYEDLELADLVVLVGSNLAWCHPVLYQRLVQAKKERGLKIVVIDPRKTATCDGADLHLALKPGSDVKLFNGLFAYLHSSGTINHDFVDAHTSDQETALKAALSDASDLHVVAKACGLSVKDLVIFYDWFKQFDKTVTVFSQGVNQSNQGTDKVNAILNTHLLTGRIGKPGSGPFSVTGQPNAMGGREVGGLANTLAAHMDFNPVSVDRVARFWRAPNISKTPGLKAVDMFKAIGEGKIKAIWIMATNPAVSMPDAGAVRKALQACPFVVVSDCVGHTDTTKYADVLLPSTTWGERDGTVTNSERCISRQRPFKSAPGDVREDWSIICDVAKRMGFGEAFTFKNPAEIFVEHAALSHFENSGSRDFNLGGLMNIDCAGYDTLPPIQWPVRVGHEHGQERLFADGDFFTPSQKGRFLAVQHRPSLHVKNAQFPLSLNTGRSRDHWHTMTRTGLAARLSGHRSEPYLDIHPTDAERFELKDAGLVWVQSSLGKVLLRVRVTPDQSIGTVFAPIHWNDGFSALAVVSRLIAPVTDALSGQPCFKNTPVRVIPYEPKWQALMITRDPVQNPQATYWTSMAGTNCSVMALAGDGDMSDISDWSSWAMDAVQGNDLEWLSYVDAAKGQHRYAAIKDNRLMATIFMSPRDNLPSLDWLQSQFTMDELDQKNRAGLLSGRASRGGFDPGPIVCSCFSIGVNALRRAITQNQANSVEAIGELLNAGTNCGSCRPEIQVILDQYNVAEIKS